MKKIYACFLWSALSFSCAATDGPTVGLLEQIPVIDQEYKVAARPIYIFTKKRLAGPTLFTGMIGNYAPFTPVCCYSVIDTSPLELMQEIKKYSYDEDFVRHMKGIKGYTYMYSALASKDRSKWTSMMSTIMRKSANPDDGSPFSAPVLAEALSNTQMLPGAGHGPERTVLRTRYDKQSDRMIFTFQQGTQKIEFSEPTFAH